MFGATCSPYLLQETLQTHLSENVAGREFHDKFYVDNYLNTYDRECDLIKQQPILDELINEAHMPLQEWVSNSKLFHFRHNSSPPATQNVLGLEWDPRLGQLQIIPSEKLMNEASWKFSKHNALALISSLFDPLGLLSPLSIRGRIFMQSLWKLKINWDEPLTEEYSKALTDILREFQHASEFTFPRRVIFEVSELHVFVDASSKAYGAVAYVIDTNTRNSNILVSKARVAPCQSNRLTIPKLELTAALIGCRLIKHLNSLFSFFRLHLWTDSKVAIAWVSSNSDSKDVYVANRVAEIQTLVSSLQISIMHVPTESNLADLLSRGCTTNKLKSSIWQHGPDWLITQHYPKQTHVHVAINELVVEINPINLVPPVLYLDRISSCTRAINIMGKVLSFIKSKLDPLLSLVMQEQRLHCNSIYSHLANPKINVSIDVKNTIKDLNLHLNNNVIRAQGRLIKSELPLDSQTPLFIPNRSRLVNLFVQHIHNTHFHCGVSHTLSVFRLSFWSPKIHTRVKSLLLRCVTCRRQRVKTIAKPPLSPLPAERVQWQPPFATVGVDHTGHFYARDAQGQRITLYICLFVCATTRAIHLEVVDNLLTNSFILCLRRLAAAKGMPSVILSDNHRTFISGEKFLLNLQEDDIVKEFLQSHQIQWRHQTPRSPWMGGHFERLVRTVKTALSSAIARRIYNVEDFTTIVKEVETIVNARPLTYHSTESCDQPLTPSQLLCGRDISIMPPLLQPDTDDSDNESRELRHQYYLISNALDKFRRR